MKSALPPLEPKGTPKTIDVMRQKKAGLKDSLTMHYLLLTKQSTKNSKIYPKGWGEKFNF